MNNTEDKKRNLRDAEKKLWSLWEPWGKKYEKALEEYEKAYEALYGRLPR